MVSKNYQLEGCRACSKKLFIVIRKQRHSRRVEAVDPHLYSRDDKIIETMGSCRRIGAKGDEDGEIGRELMATVFFFFWIDAKLFTSST